MTTEAAPALELSANIRNFIGGSTPRYATLATVNKDGSPHQIVIWFLLRADEIVVNSRRGRRWPSNIDREARASLAIYEAEDNVLLACELVRVYGGEPAQADIAEMAYRYDSPDVAANEIKRYRTEERVTFILRPTKVLTHGSPA